MTEAIHEEPEKLPDVKAKKPAVKAKQQKSAEATVSQRRGSVSAAENPGPDQHRQQLQRWTDSRFAGGESRLSQGASGRLR